VIFVQLSDKRGKKIKQTHTSTRNLRSINILKRTPKGTFTLKFMDNTCAGLMYIFIYDPELYCILCGEKTSIIRAQIFNNFEKLFIYTKILYTTSSCIIGNVHLCVE
jgi:hypothetical protein